MYTKHLKGESEFDCRRYILPGDLVLVGTNKAADARSDPQTHEGIVIAAYPAFILVKLEEIVDSVNRWNIIKVNGRSVGNSSGWFGGLVARA